MTPQTVMLWIAAALVAKFAAPYFGINLDVYKPTTNQPVGDSQLPADLKPSTTSTVKDFVNQPVSVLGVAAITFASVFLIAQIRAAGRDASNSLKETTAALRDPVVHTEVKR